MKVYRIITEPKHLYVEPSNRSEAVGLLQVGDTVEGTLIHPWIKTSDGYYVWTGYGKFIEEVKD